VPPGGRVVWTVDDAKRLAFAREPPCGESGRDPSAGISPTAANRLTAGGCDQWGDCELHLRDAEPWPVDAHGGTGYSLARAIPPGNLPRPITKTGRTWRRAHGQRHAGWPTDALWGLAEWGHGGDGLSDFFEYETGLEQGQRARATCGDGWRRSRQCVTNNYLKFEFRENLSAEGVHYWCR